jgi:RNA polymerase primary sigma factor
MTFRETTRESTTTMESQGMVPTTLATEEEPTPPVLPDEHEEDLPPVSEEVLTPLPAKGEDPVRLYLKEIGKVPLLTAQQEVQIGRRIEVGQIALRRALAGIPMAVRALLDVGDRLRRGDTAADDVIVLPEGGELEAKEVRPVLLAFARVRRLERKIVRLEESLDDRRRSAFSGKPSRRPSPRCRSSRRSSTI